MEGESVNHFAGFSHTGRGFASTSVFTRTWLASSPSSFHTR